MNKLWLGCAVATLACGSAGAADLSVPVYKAPPPYVAPLFDWTGFYLGVNLGGSIGRHPTDTLFNGAPDEHFISSPAGILGGGQIGYNWRISPHWLFGVEGDFQAAGQDDTATTNTSEPSKVIIRQQLDWLATARARLGYTQGDWLWYVTGGGAWGRVKQTVTEFDGAAFEGSLTGIHTQGGWTVGGGVETHLWGGWTVKAEYLFVDLGRITDTLADSEGNFFTSSSRVQDHIVRAGINYKF